MKALHKLLNTLNILKVDLLVLHGYISYDYVPDKAQPEHFPVWHWHTEL